MKFTTQTYTTGVDFLVTNDFSAVPVCVSGTALVKAGTPLKMDGSSGTAIGTNNAKGTAEGILLHDVDPTVNPNGALLVKGIVDGVRAKAHSGVDISAINTTVPGIVVRTNVGVYVESED